MVPAFEGCQGRPSPSHDLPTKQASKVWGEALLGQAVSSHREAAQPTSTCSSSGPSLCPPTKRGGECREGGEALLGWADSLCGEAAWPGGACPSGPSLCPPPLLT